MASMQSPVATVRAVSTRHRWLWLVCLLIAVVAVYANSLHDGFHFDDSHTVVDNGAIRSLSNIPRFFTDTTTFSVLPLNRTYRPLVSTTLAIDYALGHGLNPVWFHISTLLFFLLMVYVLVRFHEAAMDSTEPVANHFFPALIAAAWFGLHPAMAETVDYVIQRGDVYCALGCVAAIVIWSRLPQWRRFGLYLLPYAFAMLSKAPAAIFPLLLLFWTYFFERPAEDEFEAARWKRGLLAIVPSVVVTVALLMLQSAMTPKTFHPSDIPASMYRLTQPYVWLRYTSSLFLPLHLNADTDLSAVKGLDGAACAGLLFLAVLIFLLVKTWTKRAWRPVAFGLLWFVLTQLPTSLYALSELENDHRMFFSFPGLMLAVVWCGWRAWEGLRSSSAMRTATIAAVLLALSGYAYGAHLRNQVWLNEETLWRDDVLKSPHNGRGLMTYGLTLMAAGRYPEALDYFNRALLYTPNYPTLEINLGVVNGAMAAAGDSSRAGEAERHFQRAISLAPNDDTTYAFYGRYLLEQNRLSEAVAALQHAMQLNAARGFTRDLLIRAYAAQGDEAKAHALAVDTLTAVPGDVVAANELAHPVQLDAAFWINRSLGESRAGRYADSLNSAQKALALNPHSAEAMNNIGAAYGAMQQWSEAIRYEQQALAADPKLQIAKNNLAWYTQQQKIASTTPTTAAAWIEKSLALYRANDFAGSIAAAKRALALDAHSAEAWNNIAAGEASMKHWDAAINAAQHALAINPALQIAKNNLAWAESEKNKGTR
ncbi:tetratricopeptide repeat protein [Granulicella cerasi]|uniref:Tetratricopeptide repeat protein n=1 Tax=Granulicella cerasi TaxID=741063 RepID=A0ABW1ZA49_9BACT|nr:tetratricopeptide repeat protein [Granulicella cerasi]